MSRPFLPEPEGIARAPLLFVLAGVSLSLALAGRGIHPLLAAVSAPLCTAAAILLFSALRPASFAPCAGLLTLTALLVSAWCHRGLLPPPVPPGRVRDGGVVTCERPWGGKRALVVAGAGGRYLVMTGVDRQVREGDRVLFVGPAVPLRNRTDSSFREDRFWRGRGVLFEVLPEEMTVLRETGRSLAGWRTALRERILRTLPGRTRGYLLAALLGVRDPDLAESHRRWGTAHLLAVSGFHVGLFSAVLWRVLRSPPLRRLLSGMAAAAAASAMLWGYAFLAGGAPSALRAAFMIQSVLLGRLLGRRGNLVNSVSLAALCLLLRNPVWFWDVGWRLSVVSVLLLCALYDRVEGWRTALLASPAVWLATFPQSAAVFGAVPAAGAVVNMAALPLFGFLYPAGVLLSLPSLAGLPGGRLFSGIAEGLFLLWERGANLAAALLPWSMPWTPLLAAAGGAVFLYIVAWGAFPMRPRTVASAGVALVAAVLAL